MTQSPPTGELVARLRDVVTWLLTSRLVGHEVRAVAAAEDVKRTVDAITTLERELEEARLVLTTPAAFHQHALRNPVLSRNNALHIAGATDYDHIKAEVERLKEALTNQAEEFAQIAERDTDWTLFSRQSKVEPLTGAETNVFAGPDDDGTYPTAKNVFAYTTGLAAGRAIAASIRQRAALQQSQP